MIQVCPDRESQPFQPPNVKPVFAVAETFTAVPLGRTTEQFEAQGTPGGEMITLPLLAGPTN